MKMVIYEWFIYEIYMLFQITRLSNLTFCLSNDNPKRTLNLKLDYCKYTRRRQDLDKEHKWKATRVSYWEKKVPRPKP